MQTSESFLEGLQLRRMKAEDRYLAKFEKQEAAAEKMIGELVRNGETVYYVFPQGGKYRESVRYYDLVLFLIRNRYV